MKLNLREVEDINVRLKANIPPEGMNMTEEIQLQHM